LATITIVFFKETWIPLPDDLPVMNRFGFMVFNTTFNNISVISWCSVLLVEETGVPGENDRPVMNRSDQLRVTDDDIKRNIVDTEFQS